MSNIINILKEKKSLPLDKFISIALYNKQYGYYIKKNPFGEKGDYITAPLISILFGEMIAIWCVAFWEQLKKPKKIVIVELGPGDGSMCENLLNTFKKFKDFYNCCEINLLEISNGLKKIQKQKIKDKKIKWIKKIDDIAHGPIIFFGNEFFDSLPIKQIYKRENLFYEKYVSWSKNKLKFLYKKANKNLVKDIEKFNLKNSGSIIEYPIKSIKYLNKIAKKITKYNGGLLTFDYGYLENKNQNTLQSVKDHKYSNIFHQPGNTDITSHINFELFSQILKKNNLEVKKIVTQNEFLQKMGILERADILSKKMNFASKAKMYYRLKKILDQKEMGQLFKVLFATKKGNNFSLGF